MFAVINLLKPEGLTSHDVVQKLRRIYSLKRVGHMGTLDPLASGTLPVCLGQATRLIEYFPSNKRYTAEITFGVTTTTLDREGEIIDRLPCPALAAKDVEALFPQFIGTFEQEVPAHSAVHVKGKKLYEYAHAGIQVQAPKKKVTIYDICLLDFYLSEESFPVAVVDVKCAAGTYIRALARDLGRLVGCGAYLSKLNRTEHGLFLDDQAVPLADIEATQYPEQYLQLPTPYLDLPVISLDTEEICNQLCHGMKINIDTPRALKGNQMVFIQFKNEPVAVARYEEKAFKPLKVFMTPKSGTLAL